MHMINSTELDSILAVSVVALLIGLLYAVKDILHFVASKTHSQKVKEECNKLDNDITELQNEIKDNETMISNSVDEGVKNLLRTQNKVKQAKITTLTQKKQSLLATAK